MSLVTLRSFFLKKKVLGFWMCLKIEMIYDSETKINILIPMIRDPNCYDGAKK